MKCKCKPTKVVAEVVLTTDKDNALKKWAKQWIIDVLTAAAWREGWSLKVRVRSVDKD